MNRMFNRVHWAKAGMDVAHSMASLAVRDKHDGEKKCPELTTPLRMRWIYVGR